jgi:hypothetical protein
MAMAWKPRFAPFARRARRSTFGSAASAVLLAAVLATGPAAAKVDNLFGAFGDPVRWYHLYSADDGRTHIEEMAVPVSQGGYGMNVLFDRQVRRVVIAYWPDGFQSEWHYATNTNALLYLQGTQVIDTGDGKLYRLNPGEAVLADNWTGKGHRFRCEAKTGRKVCLVVQITLGDLEKTLPLRKAPAPEPTP